jgi:hypothetical protein
VAGDEHAPSLRRRGAEQLDEVEALARGRALERLVEHDELGLVDERLRHLHPLAHALGVRADRAPLGGVEVHEAQRVRRPLAGPGQSVELRRQGDEGGGAEPLEDGLLLGHEPDAPVQRRVPTGVGAEHADGPLRGGGQAAQQAQQGRLPRTVRPEQGGDPRSHLEAHVRDGDHVAEPAGDPDHLDDGGHRVTCRRR